MGCHATQGPLHAHHRDVELTQPRQYPGADLAEAEQHNMPGQPARRAAKRRCPAEGAESFQSTGNKNRQQREPHQAGEELEHLAGGGFTDGRVPDGEQIEQRDVDGVQRVLAGREPRGDGQRDHGCRGTDKGPAQPARRSP